MATATESLNGGAKNGADAEPVAVTFGSFKPRLFVEAATKAVEFYKAAFGAEEVSRVVNPKRKADQEAPLVVSAELKIGSASFLVSDITDPEVRPCGAAVTFILETAEVAKSVEKAVAAGGTLLDDEIDESENGIAGKLRDPYGFIWKICAPAVKEIADVDA